jgi:hypothetical protein
MIGYPPPTLEPVELIRVVDGHGSAVSAEILRLNARIEDLERIALFEAKQNEVLADEVERLSVENERLRRPTGLRAKLAGAWRRMDG